MLKDDLKITLSTLYNLRELELKGDRSGWGYDIDSINRVIAHIENEIKLKEERR